MDRSTVLAVVGVLLGSLRRGDALALDDPHAACALPPADIPAERLERSVPLRTGIGNSRERVTTKSPQAQAFYDQGLNYL